MAAIFLVDDDAVFRRAAALVLQQDGHKVHEAANGLEALQQLAEIEVDLVMTDLIMPEKEGIETIQDLRRLHPAVKIIAMSGGGSINTNLYLQIAGHLGADLVLLKPFTKDELLQAIQSVLAGVKKSDPDNPRPGVS
jgi:CheY-like chemotaxis protein